MAESQNIALTSPLPGAAERKELCSTLTYF